MIETVLPSADDTAVAGEQPNEVDAPKVEAEGEQTEAKEAKPEKSPEQKAIDRLERKLGRVIGQREEARAERAQLQQQIQQLQQRTIDGTNQQSDSDSEHLTLSKAQLRQMVEAEAKKLAPTIKGEADTVARQREVVSGLVKTWGQDAFQERTNELAEVLDQSKQMLVLDTDNPAALIEYLTDEDNAEEAEAIGKLPIGRAGYALAKIAAKIEAAKADDKPKASKAPQPVEPLRGAGTTNRAPDPANTKAWMKWANEQERRS